MPAGSHDDREQIDKENMHFSNKLQVRLLVKQCGSIQLHLRGLMRKQGVLENEIQTEWCITAIMISGDMFHRNIDSCSDKSWHYQTEDRFMKSGFHGQFEEHLNPDKFGNLESRTAVWVMPNVHHVRYEAQWPLLIFRPHFSQDIWYFFAFIIISWYQNSICLSNVDMIFNT